MALERETRAEAEHARRENFKYLIARRCRFASRCRSGPGANGSEGALQDGVGVEHVEPVDREREADPRQAEILRDASIELRYRRVSEVVGIRLEKDGLRSLTRGRRCSNVGDVRQSITLA